MLLLGRERGLERQVAGEAEVQRRRWGPDSEVVAGQSAGGEKSPHGALISTFLPSWMIPVYLLLVSTVLLTLSIDCSYLSTCLLTSSPIHSHSRSHSHGVGFSHTHALDVWRTCYGFVYRALDRVCTSSLIPFPSCDMCERAFPRLSL